MVILYHSHKGFSRVFYLFGKNLRQKNNRKIFQKSVDKSNVIDYNQPCCSGKRLMRQTSGRLAQLVEHPLDVREVTGSSPVSSTKSPETKFQDFLLAKTQHLAFGSIR